MFAQGCLEESFWGLAIWHHIFSLRRSTVEAVCPVQERCKNETLGDILKRKVRRKYG